MANNSGLLSLVYVQLEGAEVTDAFMDDILEITVENSLHLPDVATLVLHDGRLHWLDEASLAPGKSMQISAKAGPLEKILFDGEIVEIEPNFESGTQQLIVRAFDRLHRLMRGRHVRSFLNVSDDDLVKKIAQEAGLQVQVGPTSQVFPYVFQNNETNLAFLQGRAAALGYLVYVLGKTLHCEAPQIGGKSVELEWGVTLREFHPRLTTVGQVDSVTARGWNPATKQEIIGQAKKGQGSPQIGEGTSGGELAQKAFNIQAQTLIANRPIRDQAVADKLAQAEADRYAGGFIEAEGSCTGDPSLVAGTSVTISAVGNRFSGSYYVTSTLHVYNSQQGYVTQFGVSGYHPSTLFNLLTRQEETSASAGLVIGIVTDNQDPDGSGRVKVKYPWLSSDHASDWARVVSPGGGPQRGIEFLPEVNDEVLVGFEMDDIHYPYILGGLWNGRDAPPSNVVSGGKVQQRVIRSRSGHMITLDDSDNGSNVTIEDKNGNKIVLDSGANKLTITVQGDASLKAQGNLQLEAQGRVSIKGSGGIEIDGGPSTVAVKGSMINLN